MDGVSNASQKLVDDFSESDLSGQHKRGIRLSGRVYLQRVDVSEDIVKGRLEQVDEVVRDISLEW